MNRVHSGWLSILLVASSVSAMSGCAGTLSESEKEQFLNEQSNGAAGSGGSGGAGASGSGGATGGGGGSTGGTDMMMSMGGPDPCVLDFLPKKCGTSGCHGIPEPSANLILSADILKDGSMFVGKKATGSDPADHLDCAAPDVAAADNQLINPTAPEKSLLYTKVTTPVCGSPMPIGGGASAKLTADNKACLLKWIKSVKGVGGT